MSFPNRIPLLCLFFFFFLLWTALQPCLQPEAVAADPLPLILASAEGQGSQSQSSSKAQGAGALETSSAESPGEGDLSAATINRMDPEEKERLVQEGRLRKINTPFGAVYKPVN